MEDLSGGAPAKTCRVRFNPGGVEVEVPRGTSILEAARRAGVFIDSLCGGEGVCGKCRVIVRSGQVEGGATDLLTLAEIREGYVLACEVRAAGDLEVEIPPESLLRERGREADDAERRLTLDTPRARQPLKIDPLVHRFRLEVPRPSLDYNLADLDRLEASLRSAMGGGEFQMGLKVIRRLPAVLREQNGVITATAACRGCLTEITDVSAGDSSGRNLAAAVDVGTTTVVVHLLDLVAGQALGGAARYNSQAAFGADVIRRIMFCGQRPDGLRMLHESVVEDVNSLLRELQDRFRLGAGDVSMVVAAGNTTMMHLLLGLDPAWIRREPYVGASYRPPPFRAAEAGLNINPRGLLYCLPSVSGFVGADIVAGVLATGLAESDELRMLVDIGTNGEIVIGNRDWMVCASASAGPAFEGAGNRDGMRAMRGAVDHVRSHGASRPPSCSVVGDAPPKGFCGTAYVDLLAELMRMGAMDRTGRLAPDHPSGRVRRGEEDVAEFVVVPAGERGAARDLVITQNDIANLVRAKAAIYAASKVLLRSLKLKLSDLTEILVAGAFGNYLDLENAVSIGLLPDVAPEKLRFVGNSTVAGSRLAALDRGRFLQAQKIAEGLTYFELSTDPSFMDEFTSACFFPHTNLEEFPSVATRLAASGGGGAS